MTATSTPLGTDLHAELLDCLQANLAVLADRQHGQGRHLALGAWLRFDPRPGASGLPTVEPPLVDQLRDAERLVGLRVDVRRQVGSATEAVAMLAQHDGLYVVADAFHLPWVPYHGRQHMEHSFLLGRDGDRVAVTDAYHNDTEWGRARPAVWSLARQEFMKVLPAGADVMVLAPVDAEPPQPYIQVPAPQVMAAYLAAYREYPDRTEALYRLTLETWLLARARRLHGALLEQLHGQRVSSVTEHLKQWQLLVEQAYLAYRRVRAGKPEPTGVLDRLAALLGADTAVLGTAGVRERVAAEVADILGAPVADILAGTEFRAFPTFSSFRLIDIVERLEDRLALYLAPDDLVPENLRDLDSLCRVASHGPVEVA
jgi:hypothetical protein